MSVAIDVWAPLHGHVHVVADDRRLPAHADRDRLGWFIGPRLPNGTDYFIDLGTVVRPDPLARWMPNGVHGPSRAFDPSTSTWDDHSWTGRGLTTDSVIYELHIGTFTSAGTLDAARDHLDHLVELGITHVELMPLAAFDGDRGWGYDGVCLNAVHEAYGGPAALQRFVNAAHLAGLAVILDVVHNHLGPSGNYWRDFGPFFTDRHVTPWGNAVNLDGPGSDDVRAIIIDSACRWLSDFHLDGLRLDAVHELRDDRARSLLEDLSCAVDHLSDELDRPLSLIAETDRNDPRTVVAAALGGHGMSAQWDDDVHHALHWILTGESTGYYADFASCEHASKALTGGFLHDGTWSSFRGRSHGRPIDFSTTPPQRFIVSLQTHDQIGNRAIGERLTHLVDRDRLAAAALLLMSLPYTPMLFMGEEWGAQTYWQYFTDLPDELGSEVTVGRRAEFAAHGWNDVDVPDPQDVATFRRSVIEWTEISGRESQALLAWYADMIAWHRTELPSLDHPVCSWRAGPEGHAQWWAISRGRYLSIANLADGDSRLWLGAAAGIPAIRASWSGRHAIIEDAGRTRLTLGKGECMILERADGARGTSARRPWRVDDAG